MPGFAGHPSEPTSRHAGIATHALRRRLRCRFRMPGFAGHPSEPTSRHAGIATHALRRRLRCRFRMPGFAGHPSEPTSRHAGIATHALRAAWVTVASVVAFGIVLAATGWLYLIQPR